MFTDTDKVNIEITKHIPIILSFCISWKKTSNFVTNSLIDKPGGL